jgi:hypothetical protein
MNSRLTVQKEIGHRLAGSGNGARNEDSKEETGIKERWERREGRQIEKRE